MYKRPMSLFFPFSLHFPFTKIIKSLKKYKKSELLYVNIISQERGFSSELAPMQDGSKDESAGWGWGRGYRTLKGLEHEMTREVLRGLEDPVSKPQCQSVEGPLLRSE